MTKTSRKRIILLLTLVLVIAITLVGCKKDKKKDDEYQPTSGLVMTEAEANALKNKVRVVCYYPTASGDKLVGEVTLVDFTSKDKKTENMIMKVVNTLAKGPKDTSNLKTMMPKDAELKSVKIKDDCVILNFNETFKAGMPETQSEIEILLYAIANTVTEFKDFNCVKITSGNEVVQSVVNRNMDIVAKIVETSTNNYNEEEYADVPLE
ncbi:MAG TPA: GerMN domain-containing protein [Clostridiaceae bacterium]|jgi:spore germination protein GerM|nr:GerMN domain-containing protein [Clostridiaceae bacterium]